MCKPVVKDKDDHSKTARDGRNGSTPTHLRRRTCVCRSQDNDPPALEHGSNGDSSSISNVARPQSHRTMCEMCGNWDEHAEDKGKAWLETERWSLERAVSVGRTVWDGGYEWLRTLRKRSKGRGINAEAIRTPRRAQRNKCPYKRGSLKSMSREWPSSSLAIAASTSTSIRADAQNQGSRTWQGRKVLRGLITTVIAVLAGWLACMGMVECYIRSYNLQVRMLHWIHGPRATCPLARFARESPVGQSVGISAEQSHGLRRTSQLMRSRDSEQGEAGLSFGIVLMCDEGMWPARYTEMSLENKRSYAALHGYDVIVADQNDVDRSRPAAWSKILILRKYLPSYDYVMFMDIDALVMNPAFKLEWIVDVAHQEQAENKDGWANSDRDPDLILTRDWNGPNSGVLLLKNTDYSDWLLQTWWDQPQLVHGNYQFLYEQRGMHFLLQPDSWRKRSSPFYPDYEDVRAHTRVLDQCTMNSYLVHPFQDLFGKTKGQGSVGSYVEGDFVLHLAGKKGRVRQHLMDYYYRRAEQALEAFRRELAKLGQRNLLDVVARGEANDAETTRLRGA